MYLIVQKIHVALSSLELKVCVVVGKLVTVAFVAMATRNLWRFQLVARAPLLVLVNVQCG
jgi:hypothetical protein